MRPDLSALLWPEFVAVGDAERARAAARVARLRDAGALTDEQAALHRSRVAAAETRGDLHAALAGAPGAERPSLLPALLRWAALGWLLACAVQFVVWALIVVTTADWDGPWWLWTFVPGGLLVAALWWLVEADHRTRYGTRIAPGADPDRSQPGLNWDHEAGGAPRRP
ncbi:hypothetical protein Val02_24100 [Virgisporangium aliadipatigenens]|uniref:DUF1707 domain-containing protein n=1 Tax=Virgisporangium aliadipatigenens TaxID=741659 RepID=A0A8J3YHS5_9ACTN|nr:hypothetical protein [Virgisporangium aliadipatigenens]GIJ45524.1 hypothetical protein Val02_24100 [Virgisporangium aliadipatigenens]